MHASYVPGTQVVHDVLHGSCVPYVIGCVLAAYVVRACCMLGGGLGAGLAWYLLSAYMVLACRALVACGVHAWGRAWGMSGADVLQACCSLCACLLQAWGLLGARWELAECRLVHAEFLLKGVLAACLVLARNVLSVRLQHDWRRRAACWGRG